MVLAVPVAMVVAIATWEVAPVAMAIVAATVAAIVIAAAVMVIAIIVAVIAAVMATVVTLGSGGQWVPPAAQIAVPIPALVVIAALGRDRRSAAGRLSYIRQIWESGALRPVSHLAPHS